MIVPESTYYDGGPELMLSDEQKKIIGEKFAWLLANVRPEAAQEKIVAAKDAVIPFMLRVAETGVIEEAAATAAGQTIRTILAS